MYLGVPFWGIPQSTFGLPLVSLCWEHASCTMESQTTHTNKFENIQNLQTRLTILLRSSYDAVRDVMFS